MELTVGFDSPIAAVGPAGQWRMSVSGFPTQPDWVFVSGGNVVLSLMFPASPPTAITFLGPAGSVVGVNGEAVQPFDDFPVSF